MGGSAKKLTNKVETWGKKVWDTGVRNPISDLFNGPPEHHDDPTTNNPPPPPDPGSNPPPSMTSYLTTDELAAKRRRKLLLQQQGILSTTKTGPGGVTDSASLLAPTAFAAGLKQKLGQ